MSSSPVAASTSARQEENTIESSQDTAAVTLLANPPAISLATKRRLAADYSVISQLMMQLDGQTQVFKERYEGLLETAPHLTRLSTLMDETWMDAERERYENEKNKSAGGDDDVDMTNGNDTDNPRLP